MTSPRKTAIIASAGSGKTQTIIDRALAAADEGGRVLITTFTIQNRNQIQRRISATVGCVPPNIDILTWYTFLIHEMCRPYQLSFLGQIGIVRALDFSADPPRYAKKTTRQYYLDSKGDIYKDRVAALALVCNERSDGKVTDRLSSLYTDILIDEMQDLAGHDFELLDLLLASPINLGVVGDPRQSLYFTDDSVKNKKYKGPRFVTWLEERKENCVTERMAHSHRCSQAILDWADLLFPEYGASTSTHGDPRGQEGVVLITRAQVEAYMSTHEATALRLQITTNTMGLPAINIGVSKGLTFDHVVIFGSKTMSQYALGKLPLESLKSRSKLYVAVTRARFSAAIVVD
jgi:DNA helicase-2/ATP-dependent DNA helicase PcrA